MTIRIKILLFFVALLCGIISHTGFAGLSLDEMDDLLEQAAVDQTKNRNNFQDVKNESGMPNHSLTPMDDLLDNEEMGYSNRKTGSIKKGLLTHKDGNAINGEGDHTASLVDVVRGNIVVFIIFALFALLFIILAYIFFYKIKSFAEQAESSKDLAEKCLYTLQERVNSTSKSESNIGTNATTNASEEIDLGGILLETDELDKIINNKVNDIVQDRKNAFLSEEIEVDDNITEKVTQTSVESNEVLNSQAVESLDKKQDKNPTSDDIVCKSKSGENINTEVETREEKSAYNVDNSNKTESKENESLLNNSDTENLELVISDDKEIDFLFKDDSGNNEDDNVRGLLGKQ